MSARDKKIIAHYDRKVTQGLSENRAFEEAYSNLHGNSGKSHRHLIDKPQRAKHKMAVTVNIIK